MLNKVENSTTKTFDGEISRGSVTTFVCATASLIPSEDQVIQINVSTLYANTAGFTVIVGGGGGGKNMQTPYFKRQWTIRRVFCDGNEPLRLHLSANKDSFHSVHKPVKWTSLFAGRGGHGFTICSLVPGMLSVPLALL